MTKKELVEILEQSVKDFEEFSHEYTKKGMCYYFACVHNLNTYYMYRLPYSPAYNNNKVKYCPALRRLLECSHFEILGKHPGQHRSVQLVFYWFPRDDNESRVRILKHTLNEIKKSNIVEIPTIFPDDFTESNRYAFKGIYDNMEQLIKQLENLKAKE